MFSRLSFSIGSARTRCHDHSPISNQMTTTEHELNVPNVTALQEVTYTQWTGSGVDALHRSQLIRCGLCLSVNLLHLGLQYPNVGYMWWDIGWFELYLPWWRHQMETFAALLAICAGNSPVPGEFPTQRPVTRSFDVFFHLRLNKRLSEQS